ncbi:alpha-tocopherol transfer protein isoform X2 [Bemisia tabaci]|uniref:alpha-tocopherol transfer protein isoform X2 n=1 Tax=Bemisia tabaci TaxID=7038 RepID=UPI0008F9A477|nr:PREDICTED: alpha-tocopherol transfer protein isoform X2 [Bemisia tabaci]
MGHDIYNYGDRLSWEKLGERKTLLSDIDELPNIIIGDRVLRLEVEDLSPEMKEVARKELRENPDNIQAAIEELRALLQEDEELTVPLDNDTWLIRFLRPTKFYPESAYKLIQNYYAFKIKHNDVYDGLKPSTERNVFEQNILTVLPERDQDGRRVLILELGKKWKPKKCSLDEVFKGAVLFLEAAMMEPASQVAGAQVIFDMDGLTLQQTWQFTPPFAKRIVDWLQDSVPLRIKGIHIVNQPYIFNMVFALFKPFLREKLRSRVIFHGTDRESLHKYFNPKMLPDTYGGNLHVPTISGSQWYELLLLCDKEYDAINAYGYRKRKAEKDAKSKKK